MPNILCIPSVYRVCRIYQVLSQEHLNIIGLVGIGPAGTVPNTVHVIHCLHFGLVKVDQSRLINGSSATLTENDWIDVANPHQTACVGKSTSTGYNCIHLMWKVCIEWMWSHSFYVDFTLHSIWWGLTTCIQRFFVRARHQTYILSRSTSRVD